MNWKEKIQTCPNCGKEFKPWRNLEIKYCSASCRRTYLDRRGKGYIEDGRPCDFCGKPIIRKNGQLRGRQFYCSDECLSKGRYLKSKNNGKAERWGLLKKERKLGRPLPSRCEICGASFKDVIVFPRGCTLRRCAYHIDHVKPKSKGGSDDPENRICICWFCNVTKGDSDIPMNILKETSQLFWAKMLALYVDA